MKVAKPETLAKQENLSNFSVKELSEVYMVNEDGRRVKSLGFFEQEKIAKGFANIQADANYHKTRKAFVLTDGEVGFILGEQVEILDDEEKRMEIAKKARAKLTDEEADALGIK